jgi:hypothetical protein
VKGLDEYDLQVATLCILIAVYIAAVSNRPLEGLGSAVALFAAYRLGRTRP